MSFPSGASSIASQSTPRNPLLRRQGSVILSERIIENEVKVPKRVVTEEIVEKVYVRPEKVVREHFVEETQKVRVKIVEVSQPIIREKFVEVPEIVYHEKIVEVPETVYQERIHEVPVPDYQVRFIEVPKIIYQEKIIEVPEIHYRDVPIEKIIEVPEVHEQLVFKNVPIPQYVEKVIPEYVKVEIPQEVVRHVPVPVEAVASFEYEMPQLQAKYSTVDLNVYLPRFIEVPIPAEFMDEETIAQAQLYMQQVSTLAAQPAASLCEIENVAGAIKASGISEILKSGDYQDALKAAWKKGKMRVGRYEAEEQQPQQQQAPVARSSHRPETTEAARKKSNASKTDKHSRRHQSAKKH